MRGSDTISSSRGTGLWADGSGGVTGYGSRGARNAEHPPLAANITIARQLAGMAVNRLERVMAFSISRCRGACLRAVASKRQPRRTATFRDRNIRHGLFNRKSLATTLLPAGKHPPGAPNYACRGESWVDCEAYESGCHWPAVHRSKPRHPRPKAGDIRGGHRGRRRRSLRRHINA